MAEETPGGHPAGQSARAESKMEDAAKSAMRDVQAGARQAWNESGLEREGPSLATAALVGAGLAILEPEFIPGMLIGAGALLAPKILPGLGGMLRPMVKGVVKAGYAASMTVREAVAEAGENMQDIVAEARAEYEYHNGHTQAGERRQEAEAGQPARKARRQAGPQTRSAGSR